MEGHQARTCGALGTMSKGLIIGKFYPPHAGHHFLIDTALSECDQVVVFVLANPVEEGSLPAIKRVNLLESAHAEAFAQGRLHVYHVINNLRVDYNDREVDLQWAELVRDALDRVHESTPDLVYSSEDYGERLAEDLTMLCGDVIEVKHRMVDLKRIAKPVSASRVRSNMVGNWDFLAPTTKAALTKRIVICGGESTGTTTLSRALAARYQTVTVPEYGRLFSEAVGDHHVWSSADFSHIIDEQHRLEDNLALLAAPVMFCDTDGLATRMFHELYLKNEGPNTKLYHEMERYVGRSLYIITDHVEVLFQDDGYRLFEHQREWATRWFERMLTELSLPWIKVTGSPTDRLAQASAEVDRLLVWNFENPIEYR